MPRFFNNIDAQLYQLQNVVLDIHRGGSDPASPLQGQLWFNLSAGVDGQGRPKVRLADRTMILDDQYVTAVGQGRGIAVGGPALSPVISVNLSGVSTLETSDGSLRVKSSPDAGAPLLSAGEGNEAAYGPLDLGGGPTVVTGVLPAGSGGTGTSTAPQGVVFAGPASGTGSPEFRALAIQDLPAVELAGSGAWHVGDWSVPDYPLCLQDYMASDYTNAFWIVVTQGLADDGRGNEIQWEVGDFVKSVYDADLGDWRWRKVSVKELKIGYLGTGYFPEYPEFFTENYPPRYNPGGWVRVMDGGVVDDGTGTPVLFPTGSWAMCDGTRWAPVTLPCSVATVFGRAGDVTPQDDYYMYYSRLGHTHPIVSDPLKADMNWVASRGQNLVSNGTGQLKNNTNFSAFTFDGTDNYYSPGAFKRSVVNSVVTTDELIPVDVNQTYRLSLMAKASPYVAGSHAYFGLVLFDSDGNSISAPNHMYQANTLTTLAADLKPGDTTIQLTSAANWNNSAGANTHFRGIIVWNYVNSLGYAYPPQTYSRNVWLNIYDDGAISGNTITLRSAWTGPTIPAGTQLSNSSSGGTYKYIAASGVVVPATWTPYTGTIGGIDLSGTNVNSKFSPGTAYAKVLFLMNRDTTGNTTWVANVVFGLDYLAGAVQLSAIRGVDYRSYTGSSYDWCILNPAGSSMIMAVPTGTLNVAFYGTVTSSGSNTAYGAVHSYSTANFVDTVISFSGTSGVVGTMSSHPLEVWSAGMKRATFDPTGLTMVATAAVVTQRLNMNRTAGAGTGQKWYNSTYRAWQTYMAYGGVTGQGYDADLNTPTGTFVTAWALRSYIEATAGYGWTWESATTSSSVNPQIVAELSSNTGNFRTIGTVTATGLTVSPATGVGAVTISPTAGTATLILAAPAGQSGAIALKNSGVTRAQVWLNSTGATLAVTSFDDAGSSLGDVIQVPNTAGAAISVYRPVTSTGDIKAPNHITAAANGNGIGFWGVANSYSIYMSDATDATYGGRTPVESTSDYNMYFKMSGGTRGYVFKTSSGNVAGISNTGTLYLAGGILDTQAGGSWIGQKTDATVTIRESNTQSSGGTFRAFIQSTNATKTFVVGRLADARIGFFMYLNSTVANQTDGGLFLDGSGNTTASGTVTAASFSGAGTGLTGTAASLTAGLANALRVPDTRNDNALPGAAGTTYQLKTDFKIAATVNLPSGSYYAGVQTFTPFSATGATGGGPAYQLAFMSTNDGNNSSTFPASLPRLLVRNGLILTDTSTGTWNPWCDLLIDTQQTLSGGKTWAMPNLTGLQVVNTGDGLTGAQADTARYSPFGVTRKADAVNTLTYVGLTRAGVFPGAIGVSKDNEIVLGQSTVTTQVISPANSWLTVGATKTAAAGALEALGAGTSGGIILKDDLGNRYRFYVLAGALKMMAL